jgi:GRAM domain
MSTRSVSETVKWKMSLRKRIFRSGRVERLFRKSFPTFINEERLLGAYKCSLFTTAGPIKGRIFITAERIAFHSRKLLKLKSYNGEVAKVPYKVSIPLRKIKNTVSSENLNRPEEKYVLIVTVDEFEFWFMGFINYQRSYESLHLATYGER